MESRRTTAKVAFDGVDISDSIDRFLLSISYTDNEANETDDLQIVLEDRDDIWLSKWLDDCINASVTTVAGKDTSNYPTLRFGSRGEYVTTMQSALERHGVKLPKYGVDGIFGSETQSAVRDFQTKRGLTVDGVCGPQTWKALLGTPHKTSGGFAIEASFIQQNWNGEKGSVLDCGRFELDSVSADGSPNKITIKGTSLPFSSQIRQTKKTRAWENYNLSGLVKELARANDMEYMFLSTTDPHYDRIEQYQKSDIAFLSELCTYAGISLKATNNLIVLFDQEEYEKKKSVVTIDREKGGYSKHKLMVGTADTKYDSCRVSYTDANGKVIQGIAKVEDYDEKKKNKQQLEVKYAVKSATEAKAMAAKLLRAHNKFEKQASFTMAGNTSLVAGVTVNLTGWGAWSGKYIINQATHSLSSSGYLTTIKLRKVLEGY